MKIKSLNESRFIVMSIYGTVVVSIALTPIGFVLENYPNVQYGMIGIMILLSTSLILGLLFVTKVALKLKYAYVATYIHNFIYTVYKCTCMHVCMCIYIYI